jgi:E3 ubiquitin-protein ligase HECTD2
MNVQDWIHHLHMTDFPDNDPTPHQFKTVLQKWSRTQPQYLKKLLYFVTALKNVPKNGFSALNPRFELYRVSGENRLPVARTCFNRLELSRYDSETVLEQKLIQSVELGSEFSII